MKPRLGCFTLPALITVVLSFLVFGIVTLVRGGVLFSPGALNAQAGNQPIGGVRSHAELATKCSACHPAPWQAETMSDRCVACHTDVVQDSKNFHRNIISDNAKCRVCHTEHKGAAGTLTIVDMNQFPHEKVGYSLKGHQTTANGSEFVCSDCHGAKTSSFDQAICTTCHSQIDAAFMEKHTAAFGQDCLACHDGVDVYGKGKFDHSKLTFQLTGKHASVDCAGCHTGARKPVDFKSAPQVCFACHGKDDPHLGRMGQDCAACHTPADWKQSTFDHSKLAYPLVGKHTAVVCQGCHLDDRLKDTPQDCFSCHGKQDPHQGQLGQDCASCHTPEDWKQVTFDHSTAPFKLLGKHATVECSACHTDNLFKNTPQDCYSCHAKDDNHQGQLGTDCSACHTPTGWIPSTFDHSKSAFPLIGKHAAVECTACHVNGQYKSTPTDCYSCHAKDDNHQGQLGTDCGACHSPAGWLPATFDHSKSAFPLIGKHAAVECTACHVNGQYKGTPTDCYSCHAKDDNHQGQFGADCSACHTPNGWLPATFDHSKSTFPLTGAHASLACTACHPNGRFKGTPAACVGCHADPAYHAGLFGTVCDQCHSTSAWIPAKFNRAHSFPINHGGSGSCQNCHPSTLAGYTCYSCHSAGSLREEHSGKGNISDCVRCHAGGGGGGGMAVVSQQYASLFNWLNKLWGTTW